MISSDTQYSPISPDHPPALEDRPNRAWSHREGGCSRRRRQFGKGHPLGLERRSCWCRIGRVRGMERVWIGSSWFVFGGCNRYRAGLIEVGRRCGRLRRWRRWKAMSVESDECGMWWWDYDDESVVGMVPYRVWYRRFCYAKGLTVVFSARTGHFNWLQNGSC